MTLPFHKIINDIKTETILAFMNMLTYKLILKYKENEKSN